MAQRQLEAFRELFDANGGMALFRRAMDGSLRGCPVRGIAWRYFLGALSGPRGGWAAQQRAQQRDYDVLCARHCVDPSAAADAAGPDADVSVVNPLSCDAASPFHVYFESAALREQIEQDLRRLHPGDAFFARADVQRRAGSASALWPSAARSRR